MYQYNWFILPPPPQQCQLKDETSYLQFLDLFTYAPVILHIFAENASQGADLLLPLCKLHN